MAYFDEQILAVRALIREKRDSGRVVRETRCSACPEELLRNLPVSYCPENRPFVILKEDTCVELGNPLEGSASLVLATTQAELVRDGVIAVIGPDIQESMEQSLPFGQVILVGWRGMEAKDLPGIERVRNLSHHLEGYMIRHLSRKIWSRVSREAVEKGLCFETLGRVLMARYRMLYPSIDAIEILFVTSSKADVQSLNELSVEAQGRSLSIRKLTRSEEGTYECEELDCEVCPDKPTCDTIRDVIVIRKAGKIAGIEIVRDNAPAPDEPNMEISRKGH